MTFGIVLLFDAPTNNHAIALSGSCEDVEDRDFVLGRERNLPHLSMIHLELDEAGLAKVEAKLPKLADELRGKPLNGSFSSIRNFGNWLFWLTPATPALLALHNRTVDACAPLRSRPLEASTNWMTPAQLRMYKAHGCWFVKDAWNPHLTLQVLRTGRPEPECVREVFQPWSAAALVLARMGKFGSVQEVIHQVAF